MDWKAAAGKPSVMQRGATLAEFAIIAPMVLIVGMTSVQAGLIYHGKTTLNYATFEAARTGATNNARLDLMRKELGLRLAPLQGGDGTAQSALIAMGKSSVSVMNPVNTRVKVLNPTTAAFADWGIQSREFNRRVLPNSHLRHREYTIGRNSGLSLRDANLLKIEVTHGVDLKVPVVNTLISRAMMLVDPENILYYRQNKFPLKSVATVRMQSEAWEDEIVLASLPPAISDHVSDGLIADGSGGQVPGSGQGEDSGSDGGSGSGGGTDDGSDSGTDSGTGSGTGGDTNSDTDTDDGDLACDGGEFGLGTNPVLMDVADYAAEGQCPADNPVYGPPVNDSNGCG